MTATRSTTNARQPWTDADDKAFRQLVEMNTPLKQIADQLGRSVASLQSRATHLGILFSKGRRRRSMTKERP
jgi:hypothetical protein